MGPKVILEQKGWREEVEGKQKGQVGRSVTPVVESIYLQANIYKYLLSH